MFEIAFNLVLSWYLIFSFSQTRVSDLSRPTHKYSMNGHDGCLGSYKTATLLSYGFLVEGEARQKLIGIP